jgi:hypothetical protein
MTVRALTRRWISHPAALLVVLAAVPAMFAACGRDSVSEPETATALIVVPNTARIPVGSSHQLTARGGSGQIGWSSSNPSVATVERGRVVAVGLGTATIRAVSGSSNGTARITVVRPPTILLTPSATPFDAYVGGPVPVEQTVAVTNDGDVALGTISVGTIVYSGGQSNWLTVTLTQAGDAATLTVRPNSTALPRGVYTATVPLVSADNSAPALTVTYNVSGTPVITIQPTTSFTAQRTQALPPEQQISVTNGGEGSLSGLFIASVAYGPGAAGWLNASINPATAPSILSLRPNTTAPAEGTYTATVNVASTMLGVAPRAITVSYTLTTAPAPARVVLSPDNRTFSTPHVGPIPGAQSVAVNNGGDLPLTGLVRSIECVGFVGPCWLNATLLGTSAPTSLTLQPNSVPAAGSYTARVIVSSPVAVPAADTVLVTYNVTRLCITPNTSVSFNVTGATGGSTTRMVTNCGGGTLTGLGTSVSYNSGFGWISTASLSSGTLTQGSSATLTISVSSIAPGTQTGAVTVTGIGVASQAVQVSFTRTATYSGDVYPIIQARGCVGCHGSPGTEGMSFSTMIDSYNTLLSRTSPDHGIRLVIPFNQGGSYFYGQVNRSAPAFSDDYMPPGCTTNCLSTEQVRIVGVWIQQGAIRDP